MLSVIIDLAHITMIPMQWFPEMTVWIFSINNGIPSYVDLANGFGRWVMPSTSLFGTSG